MTWEQVQPYLESGLWTAIGTGCLICFALGVLFVRSVW